MVSKVQLEACKRYMRVDDPDDDEVIRALMEAAILYLDNAGIVSTKVPPGLYNLALWSLTLHYYEHRADVESGAAFPAGLRPIINQLKIVCQARA